MRWRVKTPLSPSEMMGRGRNGVEGFIDGPQGDREGWNGGETPSKMMGRGGNGGEGFIDGPQGDGEGMGGGEAHPKIRGRGGNGLKPTLKMGLRAFLRPPPK